MTIEISEFEAWLAFVLLAVGWITIMCLLGCGFAKFLIWNMERKLK